MEEPYTGTMSKPNLIPQMLRSELHPLHSPILEVVSENPRSVGVKVVIVEDRVLSQTGVTITGADNMIFSARDTRNSNQESKIS